MEVTEDLTTLQLNQLSVQCLEHLPGPWEMDVSGRNTLPCLGYNISFLGHCIMWATVIFDSGKQNNSWGHSEFFSIKRKRLLCHDFCSKMLCKFTSFLSAIWIHL